jgi:hypothetical protein
VAGGEQIEWPVEAGRVAAERIQDQGSALRVTATATM